MHRDEMRFLTIFYNRLKSVIDISDRYTPHGSILLSFLEMKKNTRYRILCSVALPVNNVAESLVQSLIDSDFIVPSVELDHYRITAKGIWTVEQKSSILNSDALVSYLDEKFFSFNDHSYSLSEKEKIVILLFLSLRAFSQEACIDLKQGDTVLAAVQEVAIKSFRFLAELGQVKSKSECIDFGEQKGNEQPISNFIRHTDTLPRKTKGMYTSIGKQRYFLDVSENRELIPHKLAFLFSAMFGRKLLQEKSIALVEFMESVNIDYSIIVYSSSIRSFSSPTYDAPIKEAIYEAESM